MEHKLSVHNELYETLLQLGSELKPLDVKFHQEEYKVPGCQSIVFLRGEIQEGRLIFQGYSDALITKGILKLLIDTYESFTPEELLKADLSPIEKMNIPQILSPSRANGLRAIYTKMQQIALSYLVAV